MSFNVALSGLNAANADLNVTGNNIANASTTGFKGSRAQFADVFATSLGGVSATATGGGVKLAKVDQQFTQGNVEFTNNNLDLAVNGSGFFVLDNNGSRAYTRAGSFSVDRNGYVVNPNGERLQVFAPVGNSSTTFNTGSLQDLQVSLAQGAPNATSSVNATVNLDPGSTTLGGTAFNANDPTTYNYSTSFSVYDSFGGTHTATMYYQKQSSNSWRSYLYVDGNNVTQGGGTAYSVLNFNSDGSLNKATSTGTNGTVTYDPLTLGNGSAPLNLSMAQGTSTQFGGGFGVSALTQDGYSTGQLTGINIAASGVVSASFTNGQSKALGQVALATFANEGGLQQLGNTSWAESYASGSAITGAAGTSSFGEIQSGALEASNVDVAAQLINLITAQRNFQANAQAITTENTITQTIIQMR